MRFFAGYVSTSPSSAACFEETIRLAIVRGRAKYLRGGELQERTVWAGLYGPCGREEGGRGTPRIRYQYTCSSARFAQRCAKADGL